MKDTDMNNLDDLMHEVLQILPNAVIDTGFDGEIIIHSGILQTPIRDEDGKIHFIMEEFTR
jgi:hypothetical protein